MTGDWDLGREAVPATLLDLAARKHLAIDQVGDETLVRAEDPLFADQPPAAVAIWDRHVAYGAALGVAHGAVRALALGAESDHVAWSPVGGRWRVVRIRYPWLHPPGYGWHPARATLFGLMHLAVAAGLAAASATLLDTNDQLTQATDTGLRLAAAALAVAAAAGARGGWMAYAGVAHRAGGRRTVEGRVVRCRVRGGEDNRRWYLAVDDGTTDRLRAWRFRKPTEVRQGATVRAQVGPRTRHVRDLEVLSVT